jgi:hypothetical protein
MERQAYAMIDGGESMPYHMLFYMLAHFCTVLNSEEIIYYYPKSTCVFTESILEALPQHWTRHLEKQPGFNYSHNHIQLPSFQDWVYPELYTYIRFLFQSHMGQLKQGNRIYISRSRGRSVRQIVNEEELMKYLEPFGFRRVFMEDLEVKDQIRLFSEAEIIITPHGSALAFSTFCSENATIIEILDKPLTELKHYSHIAWYLGFNFVRFRDCVPEGENLIIDCGKLARKIEMLLADKVV